jgi:hypothetical protein
MFLSKAARVGVVVSSFVITANGFAVEQPSNASGSVTVNGQTTALHHAYAFQKPEENETRVLITNRAIDAAMLADESRGESSGNGPSLRDLVKKGEVSGVELFVNKSNHVETVEAFHKAFGMPTPSSGRNFWYEPYQLTGSWIGGRSRTKQPETFFKIVWNYDVTFLTPIGQKSYDIPTASALAAEHKAIDAREAKRILPAGGGEEGAMYLAYRRNLEAKDGKALLSQMTAGMKSAIASDMHTSGALSESAVGSWAFMESMPPGKVDVVGGVRDADGTTLELRKTETTGGRKSFGTAKLVKEGGAWKVAEETWR